jgi:hypothetical protein
MNIDTYRIPALDNTGLDRFMAGLGLRRHQAQPPTSKRYLEEGCYAAAHWSQSGWYVDLVTSNEAVRVDMTFRLLSALEKTGKKK